MFQTGYWIGLLISCFVFGIITRCINGAKGREGGFWWGFFLGAIGIIVVACRRSEETTSTSYQSYNNNYNNSYNSGNTSYLTQSKPAKTEEPKKPVGWKCAKCEKENQLSSKFCSNCGERRHYNWICASCGKNNAPEIRFCPECGNAQTEEQEMIPQPLSMDEQFIENIRNMSSVAAIRDAFKAQYCESENEDFQRMLKILDKEAMIERSYGSSPLVGIKKLEAFQKQGMRFIEVDRSGEKFICPVCGKEQNSNRTSCFQCGALFRE